MIKLTSHKSICNSCKAQYLSAAKPEDTAAALLHGMKFHAAAWQKPGTLHHSANAGFHATATDIHASKKIIIEGTPHPCYLDNLDT